MRTFLANLPYIVVPVVAWWLTRRLSGRRIPWWPFAVLGAIAWIVAVLIDVELHFHE